MKENTDNQLSQIDSMAQKIKIDRHESDDSDSTDEEEVRKNKKKIHNRVN